MSKTIYYFSSTGNSLQVALDIGDGIAGLTGNDVKMGCCCGDVEVGCDDVEVACDDVKVVAIPSVVSTGKPVSCDSEVVGFVFPVYFGGMPKMVYEFIQNGSFRKDAYIFAVATCGASGGESLGRIDALLRKKGNKLSYGEKVRTVSNYVAMYDMPAVDEVADTLANANKALAIIIEDLKGLKTNNFKKGMPVFSPLLNKWFMAKCNGMDKGFVVSDKCTSCGTCVTVCPSGNVSLADGKPTFKGNCEHCVACVHWCPSQALNYKNKTQKRARYTHPKVKAEQLHGRN
jgi:ferredoxin